MKPSSPSGKTLGFAAALLVLLLAGCNNREHHITRLERAEAAEAAMTEGLRALNAGEHDEALAIFRELTVAQPLNGLAHFHYALLLQDHAHDDLAALYHYNAYLTLRPDAEKAALVALRIDDIKQQIAADIKQQNTPQADTGAEIAQHIETLNKTIAAKDKTIAELTQERDTAQANETKLAATNARLQKRLDIMNNTVPGPSTPRPGLIAESLTLAPPADTEGYIRYTVERGDTLWNISQRIYGDASRNTEIRDLNRNKIGKDDKLIQGTELLLPPVN